MKYRLRLFLILSSCILIERSFGQIDTTDKVRLYEQYVPLLKQYYIDGKYPEVISHYRAAMSLPVADKATPFSSASLHFFMAIAQYELAHYDSSLFYSRIGVKAVKTPDTTTYRRLVGLYSIMGGAFERIRNYDDAIKTYETAYALANRFKDSVYANTSRVNIAMIYNSQHRYKESKELAYQTLLLARRENSADNLFGSARLMSNALAVEGNYKEALIYSKEAYEAAKKQGSFALLMTQTAHLAEAYTQVGQYRTALDLYLPALRQSREKQQIDNMVNFYLGLSRSYAGLGSYQLAYSNLKEYSDLEDSLRGKEAAQRVTEIQERYNIAEKDKQLAQQHLLVLQSENSLRQKNIWLMGIGGAALLAGILFFAISRGARQKQEIALLKARITGESAERARLSRELHDGISSQLLGIRLNIEAIRDQASVTQDREAIRRIGGQLEETIRDLRGMAQNLLPEVLLQNGIVEALAAFCEKTALNTGLEINFQSNDQVPVLNKDIELGVYRMVQELIQNALKHASASRLLIQLSCYNSLLGITVEDNGNGFDAVAVGATGGLLNIKHRVEEWQGSFDIQSRPGAGTTVYLEFRTDYLLRT